MGHTVIVTKTEPSTCLNELKKMHLEVTGHGDNILMPWDCTY